MITAVEKDPMILFNAGAQLRPCGRETTLRQIASSKRSTFHVLAGFA